MALTQNANVGLLNQTAASASFVVPTPAGYAAGDVLFCVLNVDSKSATVTAPSGWTLDQDIQTSLALGNRTRTYWKVADGSEGSSQTWTISAAQLGSATMLGFAGADTVNPIAAKSTANNSTSSTSQSAPSVASATTGGILICSISAFINGSYTPPAGMTEVSDQANVDTTTSVATLAGLTTAATGTKTFTASTSSASIATSTIIKPAATATASVPVGVASGDLLFAEISFGGSAAYPPIAPAQSGWTLIDSNTVAANPALQVATFFRIATASEPASYDFYASGTASNGNGFIRNFAGPWAASPLDTHGTQQNASSTSITAPSVTVSQAGSLAVMTAAWNGVGSISTRPSGFAAGGSASNGNFKHSSMENAAIATGATGALTATLNFGAPNVAFIAIFKPFVNNVTVEPPAGAASVAGSAPTIKATQTPPLGTGSVAGQPPSVKAVVAAPRGEIAAAGLGPTLTGVAVWQSPPAGAVAVAGFAPTVKGVVALPVGTAAVAGFAPSIRFTQAAPLGAAAVDGFAPTIQGMQRVPRGAAAVDGSAPGVVARISPPLGAIDAAGLPPTLITGYSVRPPLGAVAAAGLSPSVRLRIAPPLGAIGAAGYATKAVSVERAGGAAAGVVGPSAIVRLVAAAAPDAGASVGFGGPGASVRFGSGNDPAAASAAVSMGGPSAAVQLGSR